MIPFIDTSTLLNVTQQIEYSYYEWFCKITWSIPIVFEQFSKEWQEKYDRNKIRLKKNKKISESLKNYYKNKHKV